MRWVQLQVESRRQWRRNSVARQKRLVNVKGKLYSASVFYKIGIDTILSKIVFNINV